MPSPLARGITVNRFVILDRIGEGGMGVVYAAFDRSLDRRVALKFLAAPEADRHGVHEKRLLREAQAMARLSHPNVAVVYEVGTFQNHVFLAMEFVDGVNLRTWLADKPRSSSEILDVFLAAGRGLAAAHAAGIVHRDFKPENILVDRHGRPRVTDFGLSRSSLDHEQKQKEDEAEGPQATGRRVTELSSPSHVTISQPGADGVPGGPSHMLPETLPGEGHASLAALNERSPLSLPITRAGTILGTPAYMSPEQRLGKDATVLSDQFSFCVALYEALYGVRPFAGATAREAVDNILARRLCPPERDAPRWLRSPIVRGLETQPEDRWPNLDALLGALARNPAARRRRQVLAGAALAAVALALVLLSVREPPHLCQDAHARVANMWDPAVRERVRAAFLATRSPLAADSFARVDRLMRERLDGWAAARTEACEATHVRGEQSEAMLDLRMQCLERARRQIGSLLEVWQKEDVALENAIEAAVSIGRPEACADAEALAAPVPPPRDPESVRRLEAIRIRLDDVVAHLEGGRFATGLTLARQSVAEAKALGYAPLIAEALFRNGQLEKEGGKDQAGIDLLLAAVKAGAEAHDDVLVARVVPSLLQYIGAHREAQAESLWTFAEAAVARAGSPDDLVAELLRGQAAVRLEQRRHAEAISLLQRALPIVERLYGPDDPKVARLLTELAENMHGLGRLDEAAAMHRRAIAVAEHTLGPEHFRVMSQTHQLAMVLEARGDYEEAGKLLERLLAVRQKIYPPGHRMISHALHSLGVLRHAQGRSDEARTLLERAEQVRLEALGPDHPLLADTRNRLASLARERGDLATAQRLIDSALHIMTKAFGPEDPNVAPALTTLGDILAAGGHWSQAEEVLERALAIQRKQEGNPTELADTLSALGSVRVHQRRYREAIALHEEARSFFGRVMGPENPYLTVVLVLLGDAYLAAGRVGDARATLEHAVAFGEKKFGVHPKVAWARFHLARALWVSGERSRALALASAAHDQLAGTPNRSDLEEVESWLRARQPGR